MRKMLENVLFFYKNIIKYIRLRCHFSKIDFPGTRLTESMREQENGSKMAEGTAQINSAVQAVNEITQKNKLGIENLSKEVTQFKV
ncbi:MAG: hypothetical protein ACTTJ7_01640 [Treponema sp.]